MQIRSLPEEERPLEKLMSKGASSLSNAELLALIIHTGTKDNSSIRLAEELLARAEGGLYGLGSISFDELISINGVGRFKAGVILAAVELGKRLAASRKPYAAGISSSDEVASMFMEELRFEKKEHFRVLLLNAKGEVIATEKVSVGELSSTVVHPREVFTGAIRKSAAGIICIHNHPSGDPEPSREDINTTARLVKAGELLGIRVIDHVIIGDGRYRSLRALGHIN